MFQDCKNYIASELRGESRTLPTTDLDYSLIARLNEGVDRISELILPIYKMYTSADFTNVTTATANGHTVTSFLLPQDYLGPYKSLLYDGEDVERITTETFERMAAGWSAFGVSTVPLIIEGRQVKMLDGDYTLLQIGAYQYLPQYPMPIPIASSVSAVGTTPLTPNLISCSIEHGLVAGDLVSITGHLLNTTVNNDNPIYLGRHPAWKVSAVSLTPTAFKFTTVSGGTVGYTAGGGATGCVTKATDDPTASLPRGWQLLPAYRALVLWPSSSESANEMERVQRNKALWDEGIVTLSSAMVMSGAKSFKF